MSSYRQMWPERRWSESAAPTTRSGGNRTSSSPAAPGSPETGLRGNSAVDQPKVMSGQKLLTALICKSTDVPVMKLKDTNY